MLESNLTWYTLWIRGRRAPVPPSFHPPRTRVQQSDKNCSIDVRFSLGVRESAVWKPTASASKTEDALSSRPSPALDFSWEASVRMGPCNSLPVFESFIWMNLVFNAFEWSHLSTLLKLVYPRHGRTQSFMRNWVLLNTGSRRRLGMNLIEYQGLSFWAN